jgi:hypothetical protein
MKRCATTLDTQQIRNSKKIVKKVQYFQKVITHFLKYGS